MIKYSVEVETIPKKGPNASLLNGLPVDEQRTVVIHGALGSLVGRFLSWGFKEVKPFFPNVRFVGVDTLHSQNEWSAIANKMGQSGLPWLAAHNGYVSSEELPPLICQNSAALRIGNSLPIDVHGAITAVPTYLHCDLALEWAKRGAWVWVDKPICMPAEVSRMRATAAEHSHIFPVDFFLDSDAMVWFMNHAHDLLPQIGPVRAIHSRLIESWDVDKEPRSWLLNPEKSGGGLGIDCGTHPYAMKSPVLELLGHELRNAEIDQVVLGGYVSGRRPETAFWAKGHVGNIQLLMDCGKGLEAIYYGMTIVGDKGTIEIFVGTEEVDPYVKVVTRSAVTIYRFQDGQIGYGQVWFDFLALLYGSQSTGAFSCQQRLDATVGAVELVGKAYDWHLRRDGEYRLHELGRPLPVPDLVLGKVAAEMAVTKQRFW